MRLDIMLAEIHGFTRNKARQLIEVGLVRVNNKIITKASHDVTDTDAITLEEDKRVHWVSRSAEKLDGFIQFLQLTNHELRITDTHCLDVGSSTGGFTQVLLEHGAAHVDAVDVGRDQLHPSLRTDPRVTSYEQTDIRDFVHRYSSLDTRESTNTTESRITNHESRITNYDIIVCDASFVSLRDIIDAILACATHETDILLLFKPQFEVGREHLRKTGVPKDEKYIQEAMERFESVLREKGCKIYQKQKSTLTGEAGNQEWIYHVRKTLGI